jgi:uncharacterized protein YwlG (UPF0340 family)
MAKKKAKGTKASENGKPQIIVSKGADTQANLLKRVLATMEQENWITAKQGKDFVESLRAVVESDISEGKPVNLFGLVRITPRLHTAGQREVYKEFGNPESGKTIKKVKAKVTLKTGQGIFGTEVKRALPSVQKLTKTLLG